MRDSSKPRAGASPGLLLLLSLIALLAVSLGLGFHAWSAARSHQESVEHTLEDYASMAVWEYSNVVRDNLEEFWWEAFEEVTWEWPGYGDLPSVDVLADETRHLLRRYECECSSIGSPLAFFRVDLRDTSITTDGDATTSIAVLSRLADTLVSHRQQYDRERTGLVMMPAGSLLDSPTLVTYSTAYGRSRRREPRALFGFLTEADAYAELLSRWFVEHQILPPSVTGGLHNSSVLDLSVHIDRGCTLFESASADPLQYAVTDTMGVKYGGMVVEAAIKPEVADQLIIGGMPRSRLPLILTLLLITAALGTAALYQLRRERQLARLRDDFVSGVSHELRTPLAQVRMFAELWDAGKLRTESERSRAVGIINREARRLTHLVENILQFSRARRSMVDVATEPLDVRETIHEVIEAFGPLALAREVSLTPDVESGLMVRADRDALKQMLLNLLDNAVKYGPDGQTVTVRGRRVGDRLRLSVSDQGPGIPRSDRKLVWEPYRRLQRDATDAATGTGIGLAVVSELTAQHDGATWVEEAEGGGACFVVELPGATTSAGVTSAQKLEHVP